MAAALPEPVVRTLSATIIIPNMRPVGTSADREMFVELAREESSFDPAAIGAAGEIGLWQIHPVHEAALKAEGIITTLDDLKGPLTNAKAAAYVWNKQGYSAWTTQNDAVDNLEDRGFNIRTDNADSVNQAIDEAMGDEDFGPLDLITDPLGTIGNALPAVGSWMDALGKFFSIITSADFWKRVGLGVLGAGVIIAALIFWNKDEIQETVGAIK